MLGGSEVGEGHLRLRNGCGCGVSDGADHGSVKSLTERRGGCQEPHKTGCELYLHGYPSRSQNLGGLIIYRSSRKNKGAGWRWLALPALHSGTTARRIDRK